MNDASIAFPDPENWIELPGDTARIHRSDLKPCGECGVTIFNVVRVKRADRKLNPDGTQNWQSSISVECPRCELVGAKKSDQRIVIGKLDTRNGQIHDITRRIERASESVGRGDRVDHGNDHIHAGNALDPVGG